MAHDFNNMLTGIVGSLDLMKQRLAQGRINELERYITAAQGAASRAATLTHRLLAFSRQQTLEPKATDANRLVSNMEELVRRTVGPSIEIETVLAAGLWPRRRLDRFWERLSQLAPPSHGGAEPIRRHDLALSVAVSAQPVKS